MTIDAYCTHPHYVSHLAPIWQGLGPEMGRFYTAGGLGDHACGDFFAADFEEEVHAATSATSACN